MTHARECRPPARTGAYIGALLALLVLAVAVAGPAFTGDPDRPDYTDQLAAPSAEHWLGTDGAGRDAFARVVAGTRASLRAVAVVFVLSTAIGMLLGSVAGFLRGAADAVLSRVIDVALSVPPLVVALAIVGALGVGGGNLVLALVATGWAYPARITRSLVLDSHTRLDILAARMAGIGQARILRTHVLPGTLAAVLVAVTATIGETVLALAGLSFLGLGAQPPHAELGQLLSESQASLHSAPWLLLGPTVMVAAMIAAAMLLSDALRTAAAPVPAAGVGVPRRRRGSRREADGGEPSPDAPPLALAGVDVTYGNGRLAVRAVDLEVRPGECLALVGESGCGKTTLARVVLGLLPPDAHVAGSARVGGTEITGLAPRRLRPCVAAGSATSPRTPTPPAIRCAASAITSRKPGASTGSARPATRRAAASPTSASTAPPNASASDRTAGPGACCNAPPSPRPTSTGPSSPSPTNRPARWTPSSPTTCSPPCARTAAPCCSSATTCAWWPGTATGSRSCTTGASSRPAPPPRSSPTPATRTPACCSPPRRRSRTTSRRNLTVRHRACEWDAVTPESPVSAQPVAELLEASRGYRTAAGPVLAADRVSLAVHPGEIIGVVGPSGAGKSTLLRLLAGIEAPERGALHFAGEAAWTGRAGAARYPRPGYVMPVFQNPYASLDPRWPIWRSITEPLTAGQRRTDTDLRAIAGRWMAQARLEGVDPAARPAQLSGGQCQRVAVLRAMIAEPALLIADEPVARQDVLTSAAIADLFAAAAAGGTAIVVASHDRNWLARIATRTIVLRLPAQTGQPRAALQP